MKKFHWQVTLCDTVQWVMRGCADVTIIKRVSNPLE